MRTHKKCCWCQKEIQQKDLYLIKKIGCPINEECNNLLTKIIKEAKQ